MMLVVKNVVFTIVVPCTVALWLPYQWFWRRSPDFLFPGFMWHGLAYLLIALGASIYGSTIWDFARVGRGTPAPIDPPKALVVRGLYRYVRNPMYLGVLMVLLGELILFPSRAFLFYIAVFFVLVNAFVLGYEEPTLQNKFGEAYAEYRRAVPRWIPKLRLKS